MPTHLEKPRGSILVGRILKHSQRFTSTQRHTKLRPNTRHIHRRIRQWLWNQQQDSRRTTNLNQRKRITNSVDSLAIARRKTSRSTFTNTFRQHNGDQICNEGRWDGIAKSSGFSTTDPANTQQIPDTITMHPYPRDSQCQSRPTEQNSQAIIRMDATKNNLPTSTKQMGTTNDRRVCGSSKPSPPKLLEYPSRSRCFTGRRFQTRLAKKGTISASTVEADSSSIEKIQGATSAGSGSDDTFLAHQILVPDDPEANQSKTNDFSGVQNLATGRLEIIKQTMKNQQLDHQTIEHLQSKHRKETIDNYNRNWAKWVDWCQNQEPSIDYLEYNPKNVLKYLVQNRHYFTSHLNGIRASIVSVFNVVHQGNKSIGQHYLIQDFFTAHKKKQIKLLTKEDAEIWDLDILLTHIKTKYQDDKNLSLTNLQHKTILLLAIFTMWRPKSDVGRLQHQYVTFHFTEGQVTGVSLLARMPKE